MATMGGGFWTRAKIIWSIVIVLLLAGLGIVGYLYSTSQLKFFAATPTDYKPMNSFWFFNELSGMPGKSIRFGAKFQGLQKNTVVRFDQSVISVLDGNCRSLVFKGVPPAKSFWGKELSGGTRLDKEGKGIWTVTASDYCVFEINKIKVGEGGNIRILQPPGDESQKISFKAPPLDINKSDLAWSPQKAVAGGVMFVPAWLYHVKVPDKKGTVYPEDTLVKLEYEDSPERCARIEYNSKNSFSDDPSISKIKYHRKGDKPDYGQPHVFWYLFSEEECKVTRLKLRVMGTSEVLEKSVSLTWTR